MKTIVLSLLACSLGGALAASLILLLKKLLKDRLSPAWHCYVWLLVMALLLIPLPAVSKAPMMEGEEIPYMASSSGYLAEDEQQEVQEAEPVAEKSTVAAEAPRSQQTTVENSTVQNSENVKKSANWRLHLLFPDWGWTALVLLWLGGTLFFLGKHLLSYRKFVSKLNHTSQPAQDSTVDLLREVERELGVRKPVKLAVTFLPITPMIVGLKHPTLYLPEELPEEQMKLIFIHELCHYKYGDLYYKELATILRGLHWFNPLCYFMVEDIDFSCELLCDQRVTKHIGAGREKEYSSLLLELLGMNICRSNPSATFSMDKKSLKRRLSLIMKPRNTSRALCLLLSLALTFSGAACSAAVAPEIELEAAPNSELEVQTSTTETPIKTATIPKTTQAVNELEKTSLSITVDEEKTKWTNSNLSAPQDSLYFPLPEGTAYHVSEGYHPTDHTGMDIAAESGTEIYAAFDGEVILSRYQEGEGYIVSIWSQEKWIVVSYSHCDELLVKAGDVVTAGQPIAKLGSSGNSTGPHLHLEIKNSKNVDDYPMDPARYFPELQDYAYIADGEYAHAWEEINNLPYAPGNQALARVKAAVKVLEMSKDENAIALLKDYIISMSATQKQHMVDCWFEARYIAQTLLTDSRDAVLEQSGYGAADLSAYTLEELTAFDDKVCSALYNVGEKPLYKLWARKLAYDHNDQYCTVEASIPPLEEACPHCGGVVYYCESFISDTVYNYQACVNGAEDHGDQIREVERNRDYICISCSMGYVETTVEKVAVHLDGIPEWW